MKIPVHLTQTNPRRLFRVREIPLLEEFGFLTEGSLRHLIFESEERLSASGKLIPGNGLKESGAIVRVGTKILIDVVKLRAFFRIAEQNTEMEIR